MFGTFQPTKNLTLWLVVAHVIAMLAVVIFSIAGTSEFSEFFIARENEPWTWFLYAFYHNIAREHLFFAVEMAMLYWFGNEVETRFGTLKFGVFYLLLVVLPPAILQTISPLAFTRFELMGSSTIHLSIFVAFALIEPHAPVLFSLTAKWAAAIFVGIHTLSLLSMQAWTGLTQMLASLVLAAAFVKATWLWDWISQAQVNYQEKRWRKKHAQMQKAEKAQQQSVDAILEKISQKGMQSLTAAEKEFLEKARTNLLKKGGS